MWHKQALRALDIATDQARALRKRLLFNSLESRDGKVAYWGIDGNREQDSLPGALPVPFAVTSKLATIRTRLNKFSPKEQGQLINWGYASTDVAVRQYLMPGGDPPTGWPYPKYALG